MESFIFRRGVVMPGSRRGHQSNFLSHPDPPSLDFFATFAKVLDDLFNAELVDYA
jgi:hypothetical protein